MLTVGELRTVSFHFTLLCSFFAPYNEQALNLQPENQESYFHFERKNPQGFKRDDQGQNPNPGTVRKCFIWLLQRPSQQGSRVCADSGWRDVCFLGWLPHSSGGGISPLLRLWNRCGKSRPLPVTSELWIFHAGCVLESPGELKIIPAPRPHASDQLDPNLWDEAWVMGLAGGGGGAVPQPGQSAS